MKVPRATYSFSTSFCAVPETFSRGTPCLSATATYIATRTGAGALIVIEVETRSSGMPSNTVSMSASESIATPTWPTSPAARSSSESRPICVGRSKAVERPGWPCESRNLKRSLVASGVPKPGVLADRPGAAAVHRRLDAARERVLAREAEVALVVEVRDVLGRVEAVGLEAGERLEAPRAARRTSRAPWPAGPPPSGGARRAGASAPPPWSGSARRARPCRCRLRRCPAGHRFARPCSTPPREAHDVSLMAGYRSAVGRAADAKLIDVLQRGRERVIGAWDLGGAIVDPGPESRMETLLEGAHRGAAGAAADPHPPRPRGRDGRARGAVPRSRGLGACAGRAAPRRSRRGCWRSAERIYGDEMGPLWGRVLPVPERNMRVLEGGETTRRRRAASSTSSTRPGMPPTTSSTSTTPTGRPTSATSPACGSRPRTSCGRPRRRPTSTSRRGSARSTSSAAREPEQLALTHFGAVEEPAAAPGADEARPATSRPSWCGGCSTEHGDTDEAVAGVRRGGAPPRTEAARATETARRSRSARRSSSVGGAAPLLAKAGGGGGARPVVNLAGIEQPSSPPP